MIVHLHRVRCDQCHFAGAPCATEDEARDNARRMGWRVDGGETCHSCLRESGQVPATTAVVAVETTAGVGAVVGTQCGAEAGSGVVWRPIRCDLIGLPDADGEEWRLW